jgi:hypothetical protein
MAQAQWVKWEILGQVNWGCGGTWSLYTDGV